MCLGINVGEKKGKKKQNSSNLASKSQISHRKLATLTPRKGCWLVPPTGRGQPALSRRQAEHCAGRGGVPAKHTNTAVTVSLVLSQGNTN